MSKNKKKEKVKEILSRKFSKPRGKKPPTPQPENKVSENSDEITVLAEALPSIPTKLIDLNVFNAILEKFPQLPWDYTNRYLEETFRVQYEAALKELKSLVS